ncbi:LUD domain-containing protein [Streptomyces sp. NPDC097619]|uniref:LutC/YkgG family protein n=1 Tax=Streptomyces sp. NPDC097619 TaxID=3157228 RepID=UPI00331E0239
MTDSRDLILGRVRRALREAPAAVPPVPRDYLTTHGDRGPAENTALLAAHLTEYRAHVHHTDAAGTPDLIARLLDARGAAEVLIPAGLPAAWTAGIRAAPLPETPDLTAARLDRTDSVVTGCALAVVETGTLVLDGGPGQGIRRSTLVPDHHVCVVRVPEQLVDSVRRALARLDPRRPLTWISGPSATSDIELDRVEGVHGPRTLDVILLGPQ